MGKENAGQHISEEVWARIKDQVESLKYETVTITVHDGRITQVETSSKERF